MKDIIYEDDPKALEGQMNEELLNWKKRAALSYMEGYREALDHIVHGIETGNGKNAPLGSVKEMIRLKYWELSHNNRSKNGR